MNVEDIPFFFFSIFILKFISQMDKHYKFFRSIFLIVCGSFQKLIVPIKYVITQNLKIFNYQIYVYIIYMYILTYMCLQLQHIFGSCISIKIQKLIFQKICILREILKTLNDFPSFTQRKNILFQFRAYLTVFSKRETAWGQLQANCM